MTAFPKGFISALGLAFSSLLTALSFFQTLGTSKNVEMPEIPDDFQPVVQFVVASDSHSMNDRVAEMFNTARAEVSESAYTSIDLAAMAGDFTNIGTSEELKNFYNAFSGGCGESTEPLVCLGNHELKTDDVHARYKQITGWDTDIHKVVNGVHFIAVSYDENKMFGIKKQAWLREQLDQAAADAPDMPIIVIQHPHPFLTVYGSISWSTPSLNKVLDDYPQVIVFSGHSHYPINDPRSVWQGGFTSVGCGGLKYYELELNLTAGHHPEEDESAGNYWLVAVDKNGSVSMRAYDILGGGFYDKAEYYIEKPTDKSSFVYTYRNVRSIDDSPVFPDNAQVTSRLNENGETILTYTAATDKLIVHDYKIKVTRGIVPVFFDTVLSDYYYIDEPDEYSINVGKLESGKKYTFSVTAANAFYKLSEAFTVDFIAP